MNESQHIVSAFDRDLEAIQASIMKMGGLVEAAIQSASKALAEGDEELAQEVQANDAAIDRLEELINEESARVLALRSPTAGDLRTVLTVIRISGNLERCGDLAKNIAKRTMTLFHTQLPDGTTASIRRMTREVELMMKDALDAYIQRDAELAEQVRLRDADVDQMYNALFREFLTFMMEDPRNITSCMHLHFIAKNVERMGDHVTSIADQVIYLVLGHMPDDERPKGDRTPFMSSEAQ